MKTRACPKSRRVARFASSLDCPHLVFDCCPTACNGSAAGTPSKAREGVATYETCSRHVPSPTMRGSVAVRALVRDVSHPYYTENVGGASSGDSVLQCAPVVHSLAEPWHHDRVSVRMHNGGSGLVFVLAIWHSAAVLQKSKQTGRHVAGRHKANTRRQTAERCARSVALNRPVAVTRWCRPVHCHTPSVTAFAVARSCTQQHQSKVNAASNSNAASNRRALRKV